MRGETADTIATQKGWSERYLIKYSGKRTLNVVSINQRRPIPWSLLHGSMAAWQDGTVRGVWCVVCGA